MTRDELMIKLYSNNKFSKQHILALRAVVQLHRPIPVREIWFCVECCANVYLTEYPCPTIEAIKKELK